MHEQPVIIISLFSEDYILSTGTYLTYGPLEKTEKPINLLICMAINMLECLAAK